MKNRIIHRIPTSAVLVASVTAMLAGGLSALYILIAVLLSAR